MLSGCYQNHPRGAGEGRRSAALTPLRYVTKSGQMALSNAERQRRFRERRAQERTELERRAGEGRYVTDPLHPRLIRDLEELYNKLWGCYARDPQSLSSHDILFQLREILDNAKRFASTDESVT